jgi:hypothetical protein
MITGQNDHVDMFADMIFDAHKQWNKYIDFIIRSERKDISFYGFLTDPKKLNS